MTVTEANALEAVQTALGTIRSAHLHGGDATAELRANQAEARSYEEELSAALEAVARNERGAAKRAEEARAARAEALARAEAAQEHTEAARRVVTAEQARIQQLRQLHWPEFRDEAEAAVGEVREAAQALIEPLRRYLAAWQRTAARWNAIHGATVTHLLELDKEAGRLRDLGAVMQEAELPAPPIDPAAVVAVLNATPRPRFLNQSD